MNDPLQVIDHQKGLVQVRNGKDAKEATTKFELIKYEESTNQSIVKAFPLTGRTHQIRVHLQYAGYPIVNDMLYNHPGLFHNISIFPYVGDHKLKTKKFLDQKDFKNLFKKILIWKNSPSKWRKHGDGRRMDSEKSLDS